MVLVVERAPASAECVTPAPLAERLREASVVFVGRVATTNNEGRTAVVRVEQVWKGAPVSDRVTVNGGPEGKLRTSVDRTFERGARYLFVPERDGGHLRDSSCSATVEYSADVAQLAPDTVTLPRRSSTGSSGLAIQAAIALAIVVTGVIVRVVVLRRRRRRAPVTPS
jgi:hypothetical protein